MDDAISILKQALDWRSQGRQVALAAVVKTWGSAPRRAGSLMCIDSQMQFAGSVSGGCVETAVIDQAMKVIKTKQGEILEFGVTDEQAWEIGLACGGNIEIYLQAVSDQQAKTLLKLIDLNAENIPALLVTQIDQKNYFDVISNDQIDRFELLDNSQRELVKRALKSDQVLVIDTQTEHYFIHPFNPQLSLYIVGAVHIAQQLVPIINQLGFNIYVVDPRGAFASEQRFEGVELVMKWPDKVFSDIKINHRTAIVALTHDPKIDDPALKAALESDAFYIGALGGRKTHASRVERLVGQGFNQQQLSRIHAPIGLDIKASNPAEIAVSIAAELVQELRNNV